MIIDYSTSRPTITQLHDAGVTAVGRYIGWDSTPGHIDTGKNITASELNDLLSAKVDVFLAFEYNANAAALGSTQGHADASLAIEQMDALKCPSGMSSYFAVDFDIPDYAPSLPNTPGNAMAKLGPVAGYFTAVKALFKQYAIGAYGGYWAIRRLFDAGLIHYGWQTVAWSGGQVEPRAALLQTTAKAPFPGTDVNVHEAVATWGTWQQALAEKTPTPPPAGPTLAEAKAAWSQWQKLQIQADAQQAIVQRYLDGPRG
jgi:Domain of unknown function (DUF1906)